MPRTYEEMTMDKSNWHRPTEEMHGWQTSCPKCELEFKTMLAPFCKHHECPVRDWERSQEPPKQPDTRPSLVDRLRTEADLCRNETADDVAALLDEAADYIQRHNKHYPER